MGSKKKLDKWFIVLVITLFLIMITDLGVTMYGMGLGYSEGNPMIVYLFNTLGVALTNSFYLILMIFVCVSLIIVREKTISENKIRSYYTLVAILMSIRIFFVGTWVGLISDKINLGVPF